MGSCSSVHRDSESAMKLKLSFGSKTDKVVIPASPVKEKPANRDRPTNEVALKSQWSPSRSVSAASFGDYGSKQEDFFDSQPWLESDCEDFYSVNGDFTPSRGNTPVHPGSAVNETLVQDRFSGSDPGPSPSTKKKRLVDLFRESFGNDREFDNRMTVSEVLANGKNEGKQTRLDLPTRPVQGPPYASGTNSVCSSERTTNEDALTEREKPLRSVQCCLSSLVSCGNSIERKKKMSPAIVVNNKA
ncbi:hypothetical protein FNV43_RR22304 [Rhamnella rubrinervis]|uniref:Uncharacterized protein n=1 Tax=Rhamnella rubrinervis TaxID=2594499 RepID=A0A8K0E1Q9_9ROSA|nr:hypothetical protein FNV43_RR22304 [Rhamnella rubrinervis]